MNEAWLSFGDTLTKCEACSVEPVKAPGEWCLSCTRLGAKPVSVLPEHVKLLASRYKAELAEINLVRRSIGFEPLDP